VEGQASWLRGEKLRRIVFSLIVALLFLSLFVFAFTVQRACARCMSWKGMSDFPFFSVDCLSWFFIQGAGYIMLFRFGRLIGKNLRILLCLS
jgi:hypothetical protein